MKFLRRIRVDGLNLTRFIRLAGESGVCMRQLRRVSSRCMTALIEERALADVERLAEQGGWKLTAGGSVGTGRTVRRVVSRRMLLGMMMVTAFICVASARIVWRVELIGAGAYEADARAALAEAGVRTPMWRRDVNTGALRDMLEWRYPDVAWIECGWRGMTLCIRFMEGIAGDLALDTGPCDVVAMRDGIVTGIVTRAGTPQVAAGDLVRAGDVLIRGEERSSAGTIKPVAARGSVYARVWVSAEVRTPLRVTESVSTGRTAERQCIVAPWFNLWRTEETGFEHEDVSRKEIPLGGFIWPLTWRSDTIYETDLRSVLTDYRSVLEENNLAAERQVAKLAHEGDSLVDNWVNWSIIDDEILSSVATAEYVADIARQERSSGMAAPE